MEGNKMVAHHVFKSLALLILQDRLENYKEVTSEDKLTTTLEGFREWDVSEDIVMEYCKHWASDITAQLQRLTDSLPSNTFTITDQIPLSQHFDCSSQSILDDQVLTLAEVNAQLRSRRESNRPTWIMEYLDNSDTSEFFESIP